MKIEIPQKNQLKIVITLVIVAILIAILVILGEKASIINNNITDSAKFYTEYGSVPIENVFKYVTASEAIELLSSEQAIILFGFKECKWCQSYAPILNDYAKENNIDTIYYVDIKEDRANNTEEYKQLISILGKYLSADDDGNKRIFVPDVYFVQDGKIIGHNNDTSTEEGADVEGYYEEKGEALKKKIDTLFNKLETTCDDSKKGC